MYILTIFILINSLSIANDIVYVKHDKNIIYNEYDKSMYEVEILSPKNNNLEEANSFNKNSVDNYLRYKKINALPMPIPNIDDKVLKDINLSGIRKNDIKIVEEYTYKKEKSMHRSRQYPIIGKIMFYAPDGNYSSCSAQLINKRNLVLTAGHCLTSKGGDHTNIIFFPKPKDSSIFYYSKIFKTPTEWNQDLNYLYDIGIIKLQIPADKNIGILYSMNNPPKESFITAYGYQGGKPILYKVSGKHSYHRGYLYMQNALQKGSSGGAWIKRNSRQVIGINSFHYNNNSQIMYSPYFNNKINKLFKEIEQENSF